jgi:hypothetical protein
MSDFIFGYGIVGLGWLPSWGAGILRPYNCFKDPHSMPRGSHVKFIFVCGGQIVGTLHARPHHLRADFESFQKPRKWIRHKIS